MAHLRVSVNRLREGMMIASDVYSRAGAVLVSEGSVVTREVLNLLTRHFIDSVVVEYKTEQTPVLESAQEAAPRVTEKQFQEFQQHFQVAENTLSQNLKDIVYQSKDVNVSLLLDTLNGVLDKSDNETNLTDMLMMMKKRTEGLYTHSINVALFGQILAKWLGCTKEEIEFVSVAGLLHDIGLLKFSKEKQTNFKFRDELEKGSYEKHIIYGYNLIKDQDVSKDIKQAVLTHHERLDGSGFPLQVDRTNINKISRIIAIADTYDTFTMKEEGVESMSAFSAVKRMEEISYNKFDSQFFMTFTSHIAETMIQHRVMLSDGREGQVVMINKYDLSRPLIQVGSGFVDLSKKKELFVKELLD